MQARTDVVLVSFLHGQCLHKPVDEPVFFFFSSFSSSSSSVGLTVPCRMYCSLPRLIVLTPL
jgi:hypothetical protein